ncbi:hypothetical protein O3P69_008244 [Scylla paramamosain]|uniref:Uncharacterized protein n=1 Tax=Scylla paramamosain TaxID=85552 RepID=A0AAW0T1F6_SCYPA
MQPSEKTEYLGCCRPNTDSLCCCDSDATVDGAVGGDVVVRADGRPGRAFPAPKGTEFDGPDPGLNAAIINVPVDPCPNGYRKDMNEKCRLMFGYGPNPFFSFTPENFKGDLQFYMGHQVAGPNRRRARLRRPRPSRLKPNSAPKKKQAEDDDD